MLVLLSSFFATHEIDSRFRSGASEFYLQWGPTFQVTHDANFLPLERQCINTKVVDGLDTI